MSAQVDALITNRARIWEDAKAFLDKVEAQQRDFTAEEKLRWDRYNEDIADVGRRIADLEELDARRKDLDEQRERFEETRVKIPVEADPEKKLEERLRLFVRAGLNPDGGMEWAPRRLDFKIPGEVKRAFHEQRDLTKATGVAGAFTVPTGFIPRLYEHLVEAATVRQTGAIIYTTDSGEDLLVPKTTGHGAAALVAEAAAIAENDAAFAQQTLKSYKYGQLIQVSNELATDSGIDLLGYLARAAGRGLGLASGMHFVTGTGTAQPEGVATNVTSGKVGTTGQTTTVIADDLFDLYHSIVTGYRGRGVWLMNDGSLAKIRKLKDTTGQFIWQPGLQAAAPDSLLGRPVLTDPNVAVMAANAKSILFGDFSSYYAIRDVSSVRFERSDDFAFGNDLITFRALIRTDGKPMDQTAVKAYVNSAT